MGKIIRREFLGSRARLILMCITVIGIPSAIIYFVESTVTIEEDLDDPTEFVEKFRSGKLGRRRWLW
jgi:hypothetical protein